MRFNRLYFFIVFILFVQCTGSAQKTAGSDVAVAFYNCENFFDTIHNPAKQDEEFTPSGKYRYGTKVYTQKLHNIASVIESMNNGDGPAIMGMAEVENDRVLNDLVHQPEIARHYYKYVWYDGPDPRGINVALLYDPVHFKVLKSEPITVDLTSVNANSRTRYVLYVEGVLYGDTVHVLVNHWPSRRGGEEQSEPKRAIAAEVVKSKVAMIERPERNAKIIAMGDFNDNPTDEDIAVKLGAKAEQREAATADLYDPWANIYKGGEGTEEFQHSWNLFDQIIVSGAMLENKNHRLHYDRAEIFKPDFIIDHYKGHEGEPKRSFVGTHWINGYSDHFPVILYLKNQ